MPQAHVLHRHGHQLAVLAASTINPRCAVRYGGTTGLLAMPCASSNHEPVGVNGDATVLQGEHVTVYEPHNIVKAVAAASMGVGARVIVGSTNGRMALAAAALGSGFIQGSFEVGMTHTPAADGEVFSLYVDPRKANN